MYAKIFDRQTVAAAGEDERDEFESITERSQTPAAPKENMIDENHNGNGATQSVIGGSLVLNGDLSAQEDLLIEGTVMGTITHQAENLEIGASSNVQADIVAQRVTIEGKVRGDVRASEMIIVEATARIEGNLFAPSIELKEGAKFKGGIDMDPESWAKPEAAKSTTSENPTAAAATAPKTAATPAPATPPATSPAAAATSATTPPPARRAGEAPVTKREPTAEKPAYGQSEEIAVGGDELSDEKLNVLLD